MGIFLLRGFCVVFDFGRVNVLVFFKDEWDYFGVSGKRFFLGFDFFWNGFDFSLLVFWERRKWKGKEEGGKGGGLVGYEYGELFRLLVFRFVDLYIDLFVNIFMGYELGIILILRILEILIYLNFKIFLLNKWRRKRGREESWVRREGFEWIY